MEHLFLRKGLHGHSCYSVAKSCLTLCDPMDTAACQASLSFIISQSLLTLTSIESVMLSNHLILYHPLLFLPSIFPSIRVFSKESALHIRWPKYWSFSFSISPSNEYSGLISFRIDWFDLINEWMSKKWMSEDCKRILNIFTNIPNLISIVYLYNNKFLFYLPVLFKSGVPCRWGSRNFLCPPHLLRQSVAQGDGQLALMTHLVLISIICAPYSPENERGRAARTYLGGHSALPFIVFHFLPFNSGTSWPNYSPLISLFHGKRWEWQIVSKLSLLLV